MGYGQARSGHAMHIGQLIKATLLNLRTVTFLWSDFIHLHGCMMPGHVTLGLTRIKQHHPCSRTQANWEWLCFELEILNFTCNESCNGLNDFSQCVTGYFITHIGMPILQHIAEIPSDIYLFSESRSIVPPSKLYFACGFAIARWGPRLALTLVPVHCIFRITNLWRICNDFDTFSRLLYLPWMRYDRIKRWQRCLKLCICKKKKTTATPDYRSLHIAFRQFQIGSLILDALVFDVYLKSKSKSKSKPMQSITKP